MLCTSGNFYLEFLCICASSLYLDTLIVMVLEEFVHFVALQLVFSVCNILLILSLSGSSLKAQFP